MRDRTITRPAYCDICHEKLPAEYPFTRCRDCLPGAKQATAPREARFAASGIGGTYLGERIRANPDQAHLRQPRPAPRPAINRLPRELIRRRS